MADTRYMLANLPRNSVQSSVEQQKQVLEALPLSKPLNNMAAILENSLPPQKGGPILVPNK